jgi:predicted component of type VI protein secretion system
MLLALICKQIFPQEYSENNEMFDTASRQWNRSQLKEFLKSSRGKYRHPSAASCLYPDPAAAHYGLPELNEATSLSHQESRTIRQGLTQ